MEGSEDMISGGDEEREERVGEFGLVPSSGNTRDWMEILFFLMKISWKMVVSAEVSFSFVANFINGVFKAVLKNKLQSYI